MSPPPTLTAEPGWTAVVPFPPAIGEGLFVSGGRGSDCFRVAYFERTSDGAIVGKAWFGPETQGPPGHAHGGLVAALLDEIMGAAAWHAGHEVVAARLIVDFKTMLPLETVVRFEATVVRVAARKVYAAGCLIDATGSTVALAEGILVKLTPEQRARFGGG